MSYSVKALNAEEWSKWSEVAHENAFGEERKNENNRPGFALVSIKDESPTGFIQCIEIDAHTLYIQSGGAFTDFKGTISVLPSFLCMIDWCKERYARLILRVSNGNSRMIGLAMRAGFKVIGTSTYNGKVSLEMDMSGGQLCR